MRHITATLGLLIGCASGSAPPPNASHPASPSAPEGTAYVAPAATPTAPTEGVVYTCPMHPEVTSDKPGQCPKCGMTLVPKK